MRALEKAFAASSGPVRAVDGIDLDIAEREFFVLLGPSGCGKTTTLRCLAGLERVDAGEIEIAGRRVDGRGAAFVPPERRDLGMVFQSYAVWPHLDVFGNVALPLTAGRRKIAKHEVAERVAQALRLVRLEGYAERPVTDLSGGQQQRVALARAVVTRPAVLLMDEPLSNLDARLRDEMRTELKRLTGDLGVTTVYVTHDRIEALSLGDRVCVMREGRIVQEGPPEELYERPADLFVARFVGDVNVVDGRVRAPNLADTPLGVVRWTGDATAPVGGRVALAIRPEQVEVAHGDDQGEDIVDGRLVARLFVGDAAVWQVRVGEILLAAKVRSAEPAAVDDPVRLRLPRERWRAFAAES